MMRPMIVKVAAAALAAGVLLAACGDSSPDAWGSRVIDRPTPTATGMRSLPLKDAATLARGAGTPKPIVVTADMREACEHVQAAMDADRRVVEQGTRDWTPVEAEMHAAWEAGRTGGNEDFVDSLLEPGSLIEGDTQTLGDAVYRLAVMCDIPIPAFEAPTAAGAREGCASFTEAVDEAENNEVYDSTAEVLQVYVGQQRYVLSPAVQECRDNPRAMNRLRIAAAVHEQNAG